MRSNSIRAFSAALAAAALAAGLAACGSTSTGTAPPQRPAVTAPAYDDQGYIALAQGPEYQAFMDATNAVADSSQTDLPAKLAAYTKAANAFADRIEATNPSPAYQPSKRHIIKALRLAATGAEQMRAGFAAGDFNAALRGVATLSSAMDEIQAAQDTLPAGGL